MHLKVLCFVLLMGIISKGGSSCVVPAPATNITVGNLNSDNQLFVTWTEAVGPVDYYNVSLEGDIYDTIHTNDTQVTFSHLLPGREYNVTVQTVSGNCSSAAPPVTEATCPSQPGALIYRYTETDSISLEWEEPVNMISIPKQFNITIENDCTSDTWSVLSDIPAINLTGLPNGCDYVFTIVTVGVRQYKSLLQKHVPLAFVKAAFDIPSDYDSTIIFSITTTSVPTTSVPTTTTSAPTTSAPTTSAPTTSIPTTRTPTTSIPTTSIPTTSTPTTSTPTTSTPTTSTPITSIPTTSTPITNDPTTSTPITSAPTTSTPITNDPTTSTPTTSTPITNDPTTSAPTTSIPTTSIPITNDPTTSTPITSAPTTSTPITNDPTTSTPTTSIPTTSTPITNDPTTSTPITSASTTSTPTTSIPTTSTPITSASTTSTPTTSIPTTSTPITSASTTSTPTTSIPTTRTPITSDPTTSTPITSAPTTSYDTITTHSPIVLTTTPTTSYVPPNTPSTPSTSSTTFFSATSTSPTTNASSASTTSQRSSTLPDIIVGAVVGSVAGIILLIILGILIWKITRKRRKRKYRYPGVKTFRKNIVEAENFQAMFEMKEKNNNIGFSKEFATLQSIGVLQSRSIAMHPTNIDKNHLEAVFPYDKSLVKLSSTGNASNGYINASYIPGKRSPKEFIVAQSPLRETVSDFWHMIWEQRVTTVVMLSKSGTNEQEDGEEYWPLVESRLFGNLLVTLDKEDSYIDMTVRDFILMDVKKKTNFSVQQFQHKSWQVNSDSDVRGRLIDFVENVLRHRKVNSVKNPTLVHCRTGGSRCGIFIALNCIITQLQDSNSVDVYGTVHDLLFHRSSMIQSEDEYVFLHQCTLDIIEAKAQGRTNSYYQNILEERYETHLRRYPSRAQDFHRIYENTIDISTD